MKRNKLNLIVIFMVLIYVFFSTTAVFAQSTSGDDVTRRIDAAFRARNVGSLKLILEENEGSKNYSAIEKYVLKNARTCLINNDLQMASDAALALIDANLDNFEAVEFFTQVEKAITKREEEKRKEEQAKQLEEFKKITSEEKQKDTIKKEYKTFTHEETGETVYLDQDYNMRFTQTSWCFYFGFLDVSVVIDAGDVSPKYGFGVNGNWIYRDDAFSVGAEGSGDVHIISFAGYQNIISSLKAVVIGSMNSINHNLFLRLGFSSYFTTLDSEGGTKSAIPIDFMGPTIGVGYRDFKIFNFLTDTFIDYNFGHLFTKNVYTSLDAGINFTLVLADLNKVDVGITFGFYAPFMITSTGVHNQIKAIISMGVGNND
jgi:hypothetical protein